MVEPALAQDDNPVRFALRNGDVYYPRDPVAVESGRRLSQLLASARRKGHPVKVAMIAEPIDLGPLAEYFGHPQQYADRLHEESRDKDSGAAPSEPLIVVMPAGFGTRNVSADARTAVRSVPVSVRASGDDLVQAAGLATQRVLRAEAVRSARVFRDGESSARAGSPAAALLIVVALTAVGVAVGIARRPRVAT